MTGPPPQDGAALRAEGLVLRRTGDRAAALACFERALAADPADTAARLEAAHELRALGRHAEAEAAYAAVLSAAPRRRDAAVGLALCARHRGDRRAALRWFEHALDLAPESLAARMGVADELRALGRSEAAERHYLALAEARPADRAVLLALAECRRERGDAAGAARWMARAAAMAPPDLRLAVRAATALLTEGEAAEAAALLEPLAAAREGGATLPPADWLLLGRARRAAGQHAAAVAAFERAAALAPSQAAPLLDLAAAHREAGDPGRAEAALREALAREPGNVWAVMQHGEHARMAEDFAEALRCFATAHALAPEEEYATAGLARALAETGAPGAAVGLLDGAAMRLGPRPRLAAARLRILREAGDWTAALHAAREAAALPTEAPGSFDLWLERAQTLRTCGGTEAEIAACLAVSPARTAEQRGRLVQLQGHLAEDRWQLEAAREAYEQAQAMLPGDARLREALARVRMLLLDLDGAVAALREATRLEAAKLRLQGRSPKPSESQLGQILEELRCRPDALPALRAAAAADPDRVAALRALARRTPEWTGPAMLLTVALRQAGLPPSPDVAAAAPPAIPRRIMQYWHAPDPPGEVRALMQGWRDANPDFAWARFDDAAAADFLARRHPPAVLRAFRAAREPAARADLFRLAWLAAEGGVYVDADDRCLAPLATILPAEARLFGYVEEYGALANDLIAAAPGEPVIRQALGWAVQALLGGDADILWLATGPGLLTRAFAAVLARDPRPAAAALAGCVLLDRRALARAVAIHCFLPYKKTPRHWLQAAFGPNRPRGPGAAAPGAT